MSIKVSEQNVYGGKGPLDEKMQPVETYEDLIAAFPRNLRYVGMTVTVLNDGLGEGPHDYWLNQNNEWVLKTCPTSGVINCGEY